MGLPSRPRLPDPRLADAAYSQVPHFREWAHFVIDTRRWDRKVSRLEDSRKASSPEILKRAIEVVKRAAAVDTGAIEGLYQTDRGFTFAVATEAAAWQALSAQKGPEFQRMFESQLAAYDLVIDLATKRLPVAEAWIRSLHAELCIGQDTYRALTELGFQNLPLPKGQYKTLPNHVLKADGEVHAYAPVDFTPAEMHRLCEEIRSEAFEAAHPALQAAYAHYALAVVHPFADGNGRVARALASVYTYRSASVPVLILSEHRSDYLQALEASDAGNAQSFVDFVLERTLDAIYLVNESIRTAAAPVLDESVAAIKGLYMTKGGFSHTHVDAAGYALVGLFARELGTVLKSLDTATFEWALEPLDPRSVGVSPAATHRFPVSKGRKGWRLRVTSKAPARADIVRSFSLEVPTDCARDDDLIVRCVETQDTVEARMNDLVPQPTGTIEMRIRLAVERILAYALAELRDKASAALHRSGY